MATFATVVAHLTMKSDGGPCMYNEGIVAVIQPGGSANDYQSIEACNEADVTMVYTGQRSFKH